MVMVQIIQSRWNVHKVVICSRSAFPTSLFSSLLSFQSELSQGRICWRANACVFLLLLLSLSLLVVTAMIEHLFLWCVIQRRNSSFTHTITITSCKLRVSNLNDMHHDDDDGMLSSCSLFQVRRLRKTTRLSFLEEKKKKEKREEKKSWITFLFVHDDNCSYHDHHHHHHSYFSALRLCALNCTGKDRKSALVIITAFKKVLIDLFLPSSCAFPSRARPHFPSLSLRAWAIHERSTSTTPEWAS